MGSFDSARLISAPELAAFLTLRFAGESTPRESPVGSPARASRAAAAPSPAPVGPSSAYAAEVGGGLNTVRSASALGGGLRGKLKAATSVARVVAKERVEPLSLEAAQRGGAVVAAMYVWIQSMLETAQLLASAGSGSAEDAESLLESALASLSAELYETQAPCHAGYIGSIGYIGHIELDEMRALCDGMRRCVTAGSSVQW